MKTPSAHSEARLPVLFRQLKLPTVAAHYRRLAKEATTSGQPYEEYLFTLLEQEASQRDVNRRRRRVQDARFPRLHTLDEYDFSLMPDLPQQKILHLARCDFIGNAENVLFVGAIGTGKTHLAISIGLAACQLGKRVRFFTAAGLVNTLLEAAEQHRLSRVEKLLMKHDLIIIDEVGFVPFSQQGANMLFTFVSQRYLQGSLLVTTNLAFADWGEVFGNALSVGPLLDRLTHRCHKLEFNKMHRIVNQSRIQNGHTWCSPATLSMELGSKFWKRAGAPLMSAASSPTRTTPVFTITPSDAG